MTREDSIRAKTWVTNDGRYLAVDQITADHLLRIEEMLRRELTPGYDEVAGRALALDLAAKRENILDYSIDGWADLELDAFRSAWLQWHPGISEWQWSDFTSCDKAIEQLQRDA
jgi:hypothetical protein